MYKAWPKIQASCYIIKRTTQHISLKSAWKQFPSTSTQEKKKLACNNQKCFLQKCEIIFSKEHFVPPICWKSCRRVHPSTRNTKRLNPRRGYWMSAHTSCYLFKASCHSCTICLVLQVRWSQKSAKSANLSAGSATHKYGRAFPRWTYMTIRTQSATPKHTAL